MDYWISDRLGLVQKQLPILAPLLPLPVRNERGEGRGEGRLLKCLNYAPGSVFIFAQTLRGRLNMAVQRNHLLDLRSFIRHPF